MIFNFLVMIISLTTIILLRSANTAIELHTKFLIRELPQLFAEAIKWSEDAEYILIE